MWWQSYPGLEVALLPWGDNVYYVLFRDGEALVVDPPVAEAVQQLLRERGARLTGILVTHHDPDHVGGVPELARAGIRVEAPTGEDREFAWRGLAIRALDTPGHRRVHTAYHFPEPAPGLLFAGDSLFAGGCGRLNGLPAELMFASLRKLAALPPETHLYCGHDYLEPNLAFALSVEPGNVALVRRLAEVRARHREGAAVLPSTLALEIETNPFLRARDATEFAARRRAKDCC
ncbi:MAG TPA: MBL fold metallo-hydrolase [Kiritimatiellia bacterium]|nr:MBL fold metallo-hydrolase [Kiritimatiellia bacterium]